jgi:hypothetical protein
MTVYNPIAIIIVIIIAFYVIVYIVLPIVAFGVVILIALGGASAACGLIYGVGVSCYNFVCACRDHLFKRTTVI